MANLTTAKLLINSTISTPGAKFLGIDLTNFYLNTPMPNSKYMHLCLHHPQQNHQPLQHLQHCHSGWLGLHRNLERDVWSSPSQHPCQSTT
jgi:hypothetical protein